MGKAADQIYSRFSISDEAFWEWAIGNSFEKGPATGQCIILFEGQILATCSQSGRHAPVYPYAAHPSASLIHPAALRWLTADRATGATKPLDSRRRMERAFPSTAVTA